MIWEVDDGIRDIEGLDEDGRPDPEYAAALGLVPAPKGRRVLASLLEFATFAAILAPFAIWVLPMIVLVSQQVLDGYGLVQHPNFVFTLVVAVVTVILVVAFALVQGLLHGKKGVTLGKSIAGIRSVNVKTLEAPGFGRVTLRALLLVLSWLLPVVGPALFLMSPLFDPERRGRGWLDMAAGTWFVDIRTGLDPYHKKRMRLARKEVGLELHAERDPLPSLATEQQQAEAVGYRPRGRVSAGVIGRRRPNAASDIAAAAVPEPAAGDEHARRQREARTQRARGTLVSTVPRADDAAAETIQADDAERLVAGAEAASPTRSAQTVLVFDDGSRHSLAGPVVIGRNPEAAAAELIRMADTTRSVSKTHVRVEPIDDGVLVTDLHSKNGVRLLVGREWSRIASGAAQAVAIGDEVRFGDRSLVIEALP